jgi:hypothetical protein
MMVTEAGVRRRAEHSSINSWMPCSLCAKKCGGIC